MGPGYRVYFGRFQRYIVVLLAGGDKKSQQRDIDRALSIWMEIKDGIQVL